jgi:hypothetical protein
LIKLVLLEVLFFVIALACVLEIMYLAWLSATPITSDRLLFVTLEYYVAWGVLIVVLGLAIALPFVVKRR